MRHQQSQLFAFMPVRPALVVAFWQRVELCKCCEFHPPAGLRRRQQSRQSHFVTFSGYNRRPNFADRKLLQQTGSS
jgi:hypothetical protein